MGKIFAELEDFFSDGECLFRIFWKIPLGIIFFIEEPEEIGELADGIISTALDVVDDTVAACIFIDASNIADAVDCIIEVQQEYWRFIATFLLCVGDAQILQSFSSFFWKNFQFSWLL